MEQGLLRNDTHLNFGKHLRNLSGVRALEGNEWFEIPVFMELGAPLSQGPSCPWWSRLDFRSYRQVMRGAGPSFCDAIKQSFCISF